VCRKITELMGGRIEVDSEYAQGSVFRFFVKTRTPEGEAKVAPAAEVKRAASVRPTRRAPVAGGKLRILIVEE
jgi:hypothetical protein